MYNIIIQSKYRNVFIVSITCFLFFVFINNTRIIEGAQGKKKSDKKQATNPQPPVQPQVNADNAEQPVNAVQQPVNAVQQPVNAVQQPVNAVQPVGKNEKKNDEKINSIVQKLLPSMVSKMLAKPIAEIKNEQQKISSSVRNVSTGYYRFNKKVTTANADIDKKIQDYNQKISDLSAKKESDLNGQYNMYKTGLANDTAAVTNTVNQMNTDNSKNFEKIENAQKEAKKNADLSKKIYDDVFGAASTNIVKGDNNEFAAAAAKQGFTVMDGSQYIQSDSNDKNLFDLEKNVIDELNTFNTIYYSYLQCSSGSCDVGNRKTIADVKEQSTAVNKAIDNLKNAYNERNIQSQNNVFQENHKEILDKSKSIDELRSGLDSKMESVLKNKIPVIETQQYDATVYTGIVWSILAISTFFYIITEM